MKIDKPSSLYEFLKKTNTKPIKRLSQNFLIDKNIIKKIVDAADIKPNDLVLEIGPGPGALTHEILSKKAKIIAVEKDKTFAKSLNKNIEVYEDDFLTFPLKEIFQKKNKKAKVIANLPYHIASPIIAKLLHHHDLFSDMTLMVQYEMAQRLISDKNSKNYGSFTIFVNFYSTVKFLFEISPNSFLPRPKVKSAIIQLKINKKPSSDIDKKKFHLFVQSSFGQRRKKLTTSLKKSYDIEKVKNAFLDLNIDINSRPENLSMKEFYHLFKKLENLV